MTALLLAAFLVTAQDSAFADGSTRRVVELAVRRHAATDTLLHDYRATVRSRLDVALGRGRFPRLFPLVATEHVARLQWSAPNDLRVELVGQRQRVLMRDMKVQVGFARPWFIPRSLGDSIRLLDDELPERAALHPFAAGAERFYHYALTDSATIYLPQRTLEVVALDVEPRRPAPALIAGRVWVDRNLGDVVRMTFLFLGDYLWASPDGETARDSAEARRDTRRAMRVVRLEAEIEYALFEDRFWMPRSQLVAIHIHEPWLTRATLPVRFTTTFDEYEINAGTAVRFRAQLPDTLDQVTVVDLTIPGGLSIHAGRQADGGRWELSTPPRDSLLAYDGWPDTMVFAASAGDEQRFRDVTAYLARLAEDLPGEWVGRGGLYPTQLGELVRFNRVQGLSLGGAVAWQPGTAFTEVRARARYGFSDGRLLGGIAVVREAPGGSWELEGGRDLVPVDPFSRAGGLAHTLNALLGGHDDADYLLATGGRLTHRRLSGSSTEWWLTAGAERHRSVRTSTGSRLHDVFFGDGLFPPNPPVREGWYGVARSALDHRGLTARWTLAADLLAGEGLVVGRFSGSAAGRVGPARLALKAAAASRDDVPQMLLRAGGPETVRGYEFGARVGEAMWAAQLELTPPPRRFLTPIVFVDAGNAGRFDAVVETSPLLGVGGGVALFLLTSELRLELSRSIGPGAEHRTRFDLLFRVHP